MKCLILVALMLSGCATVPALPKPKPAPSFVIRCSNVHCLKIEDGLLVIVYNNGSTMVYDLYDQEPDVY